ncbi:hypothetical protein DXG01_011570 [Tephrocybe rancida]|nr:hypothetical protein DXG01_011570 [Tephrocybe rancida]
MVKYYDSIPEFLFPWIAKQKMFWVATAPLTGDGLINVSPKGMTGSFHVVNANKVWYEDFTGSGIETVANARENGRITMLFHAFEGPPRILRIYGKGTVYEFGTPKYDALLPLDQRKCGSRAVIMLDVFKIGTSCGYAVPFMEYKGERSRLILDSYNLEMADIAAEAPLDLSTTEPPRPITGLKWYWHFRNNVSLSGLPGLLLAHESRHKFITPEPIKNLKKDDEREPGRLVLRVGAGELKLVAAFLTGVMLTASYELCVMKRHGLREIALFEGHIDTLMRITSFIRPCPPFRIPFTPLDNLWTSSVRFLIDPLDLLASSSPSHQPPHSLPMPSLRSILLIASTAFAALCSAAPTFPVIFPDAAAADTLHSLQSCLTHFPDTLDEGKAVVDAVLIEVLDEVKTILSGALAAVKLLPDDSMLSLPSTAKSLLPSTSALVSSILTCVLHVVATTSLLNLAPLVAGVSAVLVELLACVLALVPGLFVGLHPLLGPIISIFVDLKLNDVVEILHGMI